jgi:hypothetical protein
MTGMSGFYEYQVVTLFECMQDPATVAWFEQFKLPLPDQIPAGRYPTPMEIRGVVENLSGVRTDFLIGRSTWQVTFRYRKDVGWATLALKNFTGGMDIPHVFYFPAGWDDLILLVTHRLAEFCGPLVLLHESGAAPQVIY